nr:EpsG family protein [uncultured Anaerobutyricum sp.]
MGLLISALGSTGAWIVILSEILIVFFAFVAKKKYLKYLFLLSVIHLAWLAYHFEPANGNDLLYHFRMIEFAQNAGWAGLVAHYQFASNPALYVIYFFISKLPSVHWLPVVVVLIVYGVVFYIAYDCQIVFQAFNEGGEKIYSVGVVIAYVVFTMHYTYIISGVKNNVAFAIFVLATYLELVKKKKKILCWGLIIIALLIHPSVTLLIIVRLIARLVNRWNNSLWIIVLLLFPAILYQFLGNVQQTNFEFINNTLGKMVMYIFEAEETNLNFYPILWLRFLMAGLLIWKNGMWDKRKEKDGIVEYKNNGIYYYGLPMQYRHVVTGTWIMTLSMFNKYIMFYRLNEVLCYLCIPLVYTCYYQSLRRIRLGFSTKTVFKVLVVGSVVVLILYWLIGGLASVANFTW